MTQHSNLHYKIHFGKHHLAQVCLEFDHQGNHLTLPTWIAGSYLIREFARFVEGVSANYPIIKITKDTWRIDAPIGARVVLNYRVYCFDLSVRTAYIDHQRVFANFTSLLLAPSHDLPVCIDLSFEFDGVLAGAPHEKTTDGYRLKFDNLHQAFDTPIEYAKQVHFSFDAGGVVHDFYVSGTHNADLDALKRDIQKICAYYIAHFGGAPFGHYTFLTHASKDAYGGLEHQNSTALLMARDALSPTHKHYHAYLGLCSHEYLHAWWVKAVRPDSMVTNPTAIEVDTSLLWIFEGFTNYIDDTVLFLSDVINADDYLKLLNKQIESYLNTDGRLVQSIYESGLDTWIKYYRESENNKNAITSYYVQGALMALCLDISLRAHGKTLLGVMKSFYDKHKGVPVGVRLDDMLEALAPLDVLPMLHATDELPLKQTLASVGVDLDITHNHELGATLNGQTIKYLRRSSALGLAGLAVGDEIVAIDGQKCTADELQNLGKQPHLCARVSAFRRGVLLDIQVDAPNAQCAATKLTGTPQWLMDLK